MSTHERNVCANGISIWTATQGCGPPVVLCHGGPGIYDYLEPVAAMIDHVVTVHRYDQRGCGRSEDTRPYDVTTFVDDLDALRACWGYEAWTVIGHSWGATLALLYAIRYPERTERLVYMSGTGIDPAWHQEYRRNREAKLLPADRERLRIFSEQRLTATGEELERIEAEASCLLGRTELYDVRRLSDVSRYDRFPINYSLNSALCAEMKQIEDAGYLSSQIARVRTPTPSCVMPRSRGIGSIDSIMTRTRSLVSASTACSSSSSRRLRGVPLSSHCAATMISASALT